MTPTVVAVRPASFSAAAVAFAGIKDDIAATVDGLHAGLASSTSMAGSDTTGRKFAQTYDPLVNGDRSLLAGVALMGNAAGKMAELLDASAANHANANQAQALCSPTNPFGRPTSPVSRIPALSMGSAFGGPGEPSNWEKLKEFIQGEVFPDGNPGKLQDAGDAWTAGATRLRAHKSAIEKAITGISRERSVEVEPATDQAKLIARHLDTLAESLDTAAKLCNSYASRVKEVREKTAHEVTELTCELVGAFVLGALLTLVAPGLSGLLATAAGAARATTVGARIAGFIRAFATAATAVLRPAAYLLDPVSAAVGDLGALMGSRAAVFGIEMTQGAVRATQLASALSRLPQWAHTELENAADPAKLHQALLDAGAPRAMADEAVANNPYRNLTPDQIVDRFWDAENGKWAYPSNNGFDGDPTISNHLPKDVHYDRLGGEGGGYLGREGDSYTARSLSPGNANEYHRYESTGLPLPPDLEVRDGPIAGEFGHSGGGHQWAVFPKGGDEPISIDELVERYDVLKRVK